MSTDPRRGRAACQARIAAGRHAGERPKIRSGAGAWPRDHGLRIDHLLLSPHAAQHLSACDVDRGPRGKDSPSDHTPVWCDLTI